jgi:hypothetical protein
MNFERTLKQLEATKDCRMILTKPPGEIIEKDNWDGRKIDEDRLLNKDVIDFIEDIHDCEVVKILRHFYVKDKEIDAILYCRTLNKGLMRKIGIELKEVDLEKAVVQAVERRDFFNYFYIITNAYFYIGEAFRKLVLNSPDLLKEMITKSVGMISVIEYENGKKECFLILPSKFKRDTVEIETDRKIKEFIKGEKVEAVL